MTTTHDTAWRCDCVDACACDKPAPYSLTPVDDVRDAAQLVALDELTRDELVRVPFARRGEP